MKSLFLGAANAASTFGTIAAAASCPACFPALATLGAAFGLSFLDGYEGLIVTKVLPVLALVALVLNGLAWFSHRSWSRALLAMLGPAIVFTATWFFMGEWWTATVMYAGLALMMGTSVFQLWRRAPSVQCDAAGACCRPASATITCPQCGHASTEVMPADACQYFYQCQQCATVLRPRAGDCCVFCSYGDRRCQFREPEGTSPAAA